MRRVFLIARARELAGFAVTVVAPALALISLAHWTFPDPPPGDLERRVQAARGTRQFALARDLLQQLVEQDLSDLDLHYQYIEVHFQIPRGQRDDALLLQYYEALSNSSDPRLADIGFYGMGLVRLHQRRFEDALGYFDRVQDRQMKYLHTSLGHALLMRWDVVEAERAFRRALELESNLRGAVPALAYLLRSQKRMGALRGLLDQPRLAPYIPAPVKASAWLYAGRPDRALAALAAEAFTRAGAVPLAASALVCLVWFLFLKKLDIFEPEKNRYLLLTLALGALMSFISGVLYDIMRFDLGFHLTGDGLNDLLYSIVGIGVMEEALKIVPLLVMLRLTRQVNESIDYVIYASASALGFAFIENVFYFGGWGLYLIHSRALSAVVLHMFCSSAAAYGLVSAKWRPGGTDRGGGWFYFPAAFVFAGVVHGLFDFWQLSEAVPESLRLISLGILVFSIVVFNHIINTALDQSEFFNQSDVEKLSHMRHWLGWSLAAIVVFEHLLMAWKFGPTMAAAGSNRLLLSGAVTIYFLAFALGDYRLKRAADCG
ncbi:MAG: hypothetical protein Kow0059_01490 [Candidatus Sumerlaeia bacterium]